MFNLSGSEIIVILLLALVVLGPEKLPDALRRAGRTYSELKKMGNSFQAEMKSVLDEPMKEMRETADLLKKSVDFTDGELTATRKPTSTTSSAPTHAAPADAPAADPPTDPPAADPPAADLPAADPQVSPTAGSHASSLGSDGTVTPDPNGSSPNRLGTPDDLINRTLSGES